MEPQHWSTCWNALGVILQQMWSCSRSVWLTWESWVPAPGVTFLPCSVSRGGPFTGAKIRAHLSVGCQAQCWVIWAETGFSWDSGVWCTCVCEITRPALPSPSTSNLEGTVTSSPCYPSPTSVQGQSLWWASEDSSHTAFPGLLLLCRATGPPLLAAAELPHVGVLGSEEPGVFSK